MKIWSNELTIEDLQDAVALVNREFPGCAVFLGGNGPGVHVGPRTRYINHVHLRSRTGHYHPNSGKWGADTSQGEMVASWTEWGWFLARVFELDPGARCGDYRGVDDFNEQTQGRFIDPRTPRERQIKRALRSA